MAIQCSKCNLYRPNHEVRNGVCEECYEETESVESSSSEDEWSFAPKESSIPVTSQNEVETVSKT